MSRLLTAEEAQEFKKLIQGYQPSPTVAEQFRASHIAVIAGPAGAGKDTLRNQLLKNHPEQYRAVLSTTSRPPRAGEIDGVTYHFREIEAIKQQIMSRTFFQAALVHGQQISCLDVSEVTKLKDHECGLSILITDTEAELQKLKPDLQTIFLVPPTIDELLARINKDRDLSEAEIHRRLQAARHEVASALDRQDYYCLVSQTVSGVTHAAHEFLQQGIQLKEQDTHARQIMRTLLADLS